MGCDRPKQYLPLHGRNVLYHSLRALARLEELSSLFLVLSPQDGHFGPESVPDEARDRLRVLRLGGPSRSASVAAGLRAMAGQVADSDWVLVHDAARPCVRPGQLRRLLAEVGDDRVGGLLAVPVADTLKRGGDDGRVLATEPRERLWQAQTPQMFRHGLLMAALDRHGDAEPTDEAGAMERDGHRPLLVPSDIGNLKVTWPQDLELAAMLLAMQGDDS